jgi:hypothetical protein
MRSSTRLRNRPCGCNASTAAGDTPGMNRDELDIRFGLVVLRVGTALWGACAVAAWSYGLPGVAVGLFGLVTVVCGLFWALLAWGMPV